MKQRDPSLRVEPLSESLSVLSEATARPWRPDGRMVSGKKHTYFIVGGADGEHPTMFLESTCNEAAEIGQLRANAALIVRAVNRDHHFDALVKALLIADEYIDRYEMLNEEVAAFDAALAGAK